MLQLKMTSKLNLAVALSAAILFQVGCSGGSQPKLSDKPNVELIQDMMVSPAIKAQDFHHPDDTTKAGSRLPPANTVPVGYKPYMYHLNPEAAQIALKNPLTGQMTPEIIKLGQTKYEIYCAVCHGYEGKGDGPVAPKMALKPPALVKARAETEFNDARLYHIITDGQGVMSSYAQQIPNENDRWAIVNYVRSLQKLSK